MSETGPCAHTCVRVPDLSGPNPSHRGGLCRGPQRGTDGLRTPPVTPTRTTEISEEGDPRWGRRGRSTPTLVPQVLRDVSREVPRCPLDDGPRPKDVLFPTLPYTGPPKRQEDGEREGPTSGPDSPLVAPVTPRPSSDETHPRDGTGRDTRSWVVPPVQLEWYGYLR